MSMQMNTDKKMIILEGCDGSGKSTLAKQLSKDLDLPIAERVVTSENGPPSKAELIKWTYKELADPTPKIYDRFPIFSDPIYARVLDRERFIGDGTIRHFHDEYRPLVVLCDPGFKVVEQNVLAEPQMPGVVENLPQLYAQYRRLPFIDYIFDHTADHDDKLLGYGFLKTLMADYLTSEDYDG